MRVTLPNDSLADWRSRWDGIYQFLEGWRGKPFRPAPANQRIAELEFSLEATLPPSMREWISFVLAREEFKDCCSLSGLLSVDRLDDHDAVALLQAEGDVYWAVKARDLALPDPPVGIYYPDHDFHDPANPQRTRLTSGGDCARHVSHFAFYYMLSYFSSAGGGFSVDVDAAAFDEAALTRDFGAPSTFGAVEVFANDEVLVWRTLPGLKVWRGDVHVELRHETDVRVLPGSVRELLAHAEIFRGVIARPEVHERRKASRPWWRRPVG